MDGRARLTTGLRAEIDREREPLVTDVRGALQRVDAGAPSGAMDPGAVQRRTQEIDAVTARVKQVSAALVPLGKAAFLLDEHAVTLGEWRRDVNDQYDADLRRLALHGLVAVAVAAILAASAAWRRATFRYVQAPRRQRQSLLARRIIVAVALVLVMLFSFVTELGSVATFAGFITAGLAISLQNVILSVAAYFFLIGKYGISVGDRVQIAGVIGDVVDIGLVRLHLVEVGADGLPTGRVVVFSNAVLFQPTANLFEQIPGSSYTWHQVTLTLAPDTDGRYRARIERDHDAMAQQVSPVSIHSPRPQSQLRLTASGLEMTIRFPVPLDRAPAVDDEVTRALLGAIDAPPRLKLVGTATPTIRSVPEAAPA